MASALRALELNRDAGAVHAQAAHNGAARAVSPASSASAGVVADIAQRVGRSRSGQRFGRHAAGLCRAPVRRRSPRGAPCAPWTPIRRRPSAARRPASREPRHRRCPTPRRAPAAGHGARRAGSRRSAACPAGAAAPVRRSARAKGASIGGAPTSLRTRAHSLAKACSWCARPSSASRCIALRRDVARQLVRVGREVEDPGAGRLEAVAIGDLREQPVGLADGVQALLADRRRPGPAGAATSAACRAPAPTRHWPAARTRCRARRCRCAPLRARPSGPSAVWQRRCRSSGVARSPARSAGSRVASRSAVSRPASSRSITRVGAGLCQGRGLRAQVVVAARDACVNGSAAIVVRPSALAAFSTGAMRSIGQQRVDQHDLGDAALRQFAQPQRGHLGRDDVAAALAMLRQQRDRRAQRHAGAAFAQQLDALPRVFAARHALLQRGRRGDLDRRGPARPVESRARPAPSASSCRRPSARPGRRSG